MATKLCCMAVDESRTSSPQPPNAPVTEATPVKLPLLSDQTPSQSSRFTSAQTGDLCEIRNIFQNASSNLPNPSPPKKPQGRARFLKPSLYSLHSLHKMKSVHSMIRRKLSRDLTRKSSSEHTKAGGAAKNVSAGGTGNPDIAFRHSKGPPNLQLKLTKFDLKENLLSHKEPQEGGYDPDAEVLDDIGKNVGKRPPKRPSIHSIEWSPPTASKPTPGSSSQSRYSQLMPRVKPYQIKSKPTPVSKVLSTPDLQINAGNGRDRKQRRSHSATSVELPARSPLSPLRLPSLKGTDIEGIAWSAALNESLRLSQIPDTSARASTTQSKTSFRAPVKPKIIDTGFKLQTDGTLTPDIRVQEPTATTTPRPSTSLQGTVRINSTNVAQDGKTEDDEEHAHDNPRESLHLYSMRISHHLRSGSLLSWDNLKDTSELSTHVRPSLQDGSNSDMSQLSRMQTHLSRHNRQASSSGFASSNVPSKWGRVISGEVREDKSSVYSSRPQSPPDGCSGSPPNVPQTFKTNTPPKNASAVNNNLRRSNSYSEGIVSSSKTPADPPSLSNFSTPINQLSHKRARLARSNSSSSTKKSRFREEFSPSPPKRRITASISIMRLLNPKRSSFRSRSEANIKSPVNPAVDGSLDAPPPPATYRERRLSRSLSSFETEQEAFGKDRSNSHVWEKALMIHQDERAAFFVSKDKHLAVRSSPLRERSASVARTRASVDFNTPASETNSLKRFSAPPFGAPSPSQEAVKSDQETRTNRRTAVVGKNATDISFDDEIQRCFDQQTDTIETVGAWGRYPSHSREGRTGSAGHLDAVQTRDFALEAAIKFATGKDINSKEDDVDPAERPASPPLLPGEKKRRKKIGNMRMVKSNSMTFGKTFLKNYTKLFKSQSIEFQKHGRGHRSSISSGGTLEYPELEILPDVWRRGVIEERSGEHSQSSSDDHDDNRGLESSKKGKEKAREQDSRSTLRPPNSVTLPQDNAVPALDGQLDSVSVKDNARVLSAYYEDCLPAFPRASTELDGGLADFGVPSRRSFDSKCVSTHTRTLPGRFPKHSRNASRVSRYSAASTASMRPSFVSSGENENAMDQVSIASVRRSTMDLIAIYKEQEVTEREKVLSLMRAESKEKQMLAGL